MVERKPVGVLQATRQAKLAVHNSNIVINSPISRKRKNDENVNPTQAISRNSIYEDPPTPATKRTKLSNKVDCAVQTSLPCCACTLASSSSKDLPDTRAPEETQAAAANVQPDTVKSSAQDVLDMLTSDKPGERYWEMVASERKAALLSSLAENKQLYECNSQLQQKVHSMTNRIDFLRKENTMLEDMLAEAKALAELVEAATENDSEVREDDELLQFPQHPRSLRQESHQDKTCDSNKPVS